MKINKISQKILASVLILAVLICGMFFLTACGEDEDKNAELNNNAEFVAKAQSCITKMNTKLSKELNPRSEYQKNLGYSVIGVKYYSNYVFQDYGSGLVNDLSNFDVAEDVCNTVSEGIKNMNCIMNNSESFKTGELYMDESDDHVKFKGVVKVDTAKNLVSFYCKSVPIVGSNFFWAIIDVQLNSDCSDWNDVTCRMADNSAYSQVVYIKNCQTEGTDNSLSSVNLITMSSTGIIEDYYGIDMDYGWVHREGLPVSEEAQNVLIGKYYNVANLNKIKELVNSEIADKEPYEILNFLNESL